jgi:hypothetical protein
MRSVDWTGLASTRPQVRKGLFDRVMGVAQSNSGLNSGEVLDELEQLDVERKAKQQLANRRDDPINPRPGRRSAHRDDFPPQ